MSRERKIKRLNIWEKYEKKPKPRELTREEKEKLRQEQQGQVRHTTGEKPTGRKPEEQPTPRWEPRGWEPKKLNREVIAKLVAWHLREDPKIKKLAEEVAQKVIVRILPEITELVISQMVKVIHNAVLKGAKVEIRGLATWRTKNGKIKAKNHIKPKPPTQP
jgi:nucleoid DNA-binding protein